MVPKIAIIGSGFAGIGAAVKLRQAGFDATVFERSDDVGGVWRDNTYPGCACDVQSHLYSFSFAPNPGWSRLYSPQPEILAYLRKVAADHDVKPRFGHEVKDVRWVDGAWTLETSRGDFRADVVVAAQGALSEPALAKLPGLEKFAGKVMHSARWDASYDLRGKRVAVVGTGASAIQIVPEIAPVVAALAVFQRTPPWIFPRHDQPIDDVTQQRFARFPLLQKAQRAFIRLTRGLLRYAFVDERIERVLRRMALRYLERKVRDPALREKLTPSYAVGCKRILLSDDYLPALQRDNVDLVTDAVVEVKERSVVDAAGVERAVDCIILGTGFQITDPPMARHVHGRDGRSLAEVWQGAPRAHLGTTIPGFPSFFLMQGPNSGLGHSSVLEMIEAQLEHVVNAVRYIAHHGPVEPKAEALARFCADVDKLSQGTVWESGCSSWYLDRTGRNSTMWPGSVASFRRRVAPFNAREYLVVDDARALDGGHARVDAGQAPFDAPIGGAGLASARTAAGAQPTTSNAGIAEVSGAVHR